MTLNGEVAAALGNWQAVTLILLVFLLHAVWRWSWRNFSAARPGRRGVR
jgi:hypothetical protein